MNKKVFLIVVFLILLVIFIVPKGKNDNIQINSKQYSEGSGSKTAAEYLKEKSNDISVTNYNDGNKGEMYTFNHEATNQTLAQTDYRYIGDDPNNYVYFNCDDMDNQSSSTCEVWRILGVFDVDDGTGNIEQRIKLVRGSLFATKMYWTVWNGSLDNNDWKYPDESLKLFLNENGDYYEKTGEAATYGLRTSAKNLIDNAKYYLGASANSGITTEQLYVNERGSITCGACNSDTNKLTWVGKVGLMYPSDEYMVYGNGVNDSCYINPRECSGANAQDGWVYRSNFLEGQSSSNFTWLLSTLAGDATRVLLVGSSGTLGSNYSSAYKQGVRPVVYLKSNIYIKDGDGSIDNPYSLSLTPVVDDNSIIDDNNNSSNDNIDNNSNEVVDNSASSVVVDNNKSKVIVTVANTLKYMSWIIIALSVAIVIMGCSILGYNYYKSRKERK